MSEFTSTFLNEDWSGGAEGPRVFIGAFGKHPGWNDHMDDVGLATHSLAALRRVLYGAGIASQIESAIWESSEKEKILPEFDHVFCWRRPSEMIVGRLWTSSDGKGRRLYPMVVAAHAIGTSFDLAARHLLPGLERLEKQCRSAAGAGEVMSAVEATEAKLRSEIAGERDGAPLESSVGVTAWAHHFNRTPAPLLRVFYHLSIHFQAFAPGGQMAWAGDVTPNRSRHLRLPVIAEANAAETLNAWLSFLTTQLDPAAPLLAVLPHGQPWADVIVGEPVPSDFFVLRANLAAVPLVTDIPYQIDADLPAKLRAVVEPLASKQLPSISALNGQSFASNLNLAQRWLARQRPSGRGLFNRLFRSG